MQHDVKLGSDNDKLESSTLIYVMSQCQSDRVEFCQCFAKSLNNSLRKVHNIIPISKDKLSYLLSLSYICDLIT